MNGGVTAVQKGQGFPYVYANLAIKPKLTLKRAFTPSQPLKPFSYMQKRF